MFFTRKRNVSSEAKQHRDSKMTEEEGSSAEIRDQSESD